MYRLLVVSLLVTLPSFPASAATCSCAGVPLLGAMESSPPGAGAWYIGTSYEYHDISDLVRGSDEVSDETGRDRNSESLIVEATYGINDRWAVSALVAGVEHERSIGSSSSTGSGLGDSIVMLKYSPRRVGLTDRLGYSFGLGARIPTGDDEERDLVVLAEDLQPSTGAWGTVAWARVDRSFSQSAKTQIFGSVSYQSNGENDRDYRFGDVWSLAGGSSYQTDGRWGFAAQFLYRHAERDERGSSEIPNTGGEWLYFEPSVQFNFSPNVAARLSGRVPVWRDLNDALQFTTSYSVSVAVSYTFE
jgi:hypothetical protein